MRNGSVEMKIKVLSSMFPEKIEFDGEKYRTNSYNKVLDLIYQHTNELLGRENEKGEAVANFSFFCTQSRGRTGTGCPTGV